MTENLYNSVTKAIEICVGNLLTVKLERIYWCAGLPDLPDFIDRTVG